MFGIIIIVLILFFIWLCFFFPTPHLNPLNLFPIVDFSNDWKAIWKIFINLKHINYIGTFGTLLKDNITDTCFFKFKRYIIIVQNWTNGVYCENSNIDGFSIDLFNTTNLLDAWSDKGRYNVGSYHWFVSNDMGWGWIQKIVIIVIEKYLLSLLPEKPKKISDI